MKVLAIAKTIKPTSGWGRLCRSTVENESALGMECIAAVESRESSSSRFELPILQPFSLGNFMPNILKVRKAAKGFDIVHALDGWPYGIYGYFAVFGTNKKLFINGIGTYSVISGAFFKRKLMNLAYHRAKRIFCISRYVMQRINESAGAHLENMEVVHMGTTPLPVLDEAEINECLKKFGLDGKPSPVILTVGQIKDRKGQLETAQAILKLKTQYPKILYLVVGSDAERAYVDTIRHFIEDNQLTENLRIITDAKDDRDLAFFYQMCDVFVLNSNNSGPHFEGFGLVFLEAGQFGKPSIGSEGSGAEDAIQNGYNGFLVRQRDPDDTAEKIQLILNTDTALLAKNSLEFSRRFSWRKMAEEYIESYRI